jgi:hypothetical protein
VSKKPNMSDAMMAIAAKSEAVIPSKPDVSMPTRSDAVESIPHATSSALKEKPVTLPKMTLYAHAKVLKAVRLIAVEDGVQAQAILRDALRDYLAKRGHHFNDLASGK